VQPGRSRLDDARGARRADVRARDVEHLARTGDEAGRMAQAHAAARHVEGLGEHVDVGQRRALPADHDGGWLDDVEPVKTPTLRTHVPVVLGADLTRLSRILSFL